MIEIFYHYSKKSLFKFDKASQQFKESGLSKEHRRNPSDMSNDEYLVQFDGNDNNKKRDKVLICAADSSLIRKIYLPLTSYMNEIEVFMKCKSG